MQIKLATARSLGYTGDAQGLRDPNTNLTYGVKYLAGAYRAANGDHSRAVHYFAAGYYEAAKHQKLQQVAEVRHGRSGRRARRSISHPKSCRASCRMGRPRHRPMRQAPPTRRPRFRRSNAYPVRAGLT